MSVHVHMNHAHVKPKVENADIKKVEEVKK